MPCDHPACTVGICPYPDVMSGETLYHFGLIVLGTAAAVACAVLLFISAPYGRHRRGGWGPEVNARAGWVLQEIPAPVVFAGVFFAGPWAMDAVPLIFFTLWEAHYVHRTFVFPFQLRIAGKRNPLVTVVLAFLFNVINAFVNAFALTHGARYASTWPADPRCLLGITLFVAGYAINRHADRILIRLRGPRETGYRIPRGGLFRWLTSPNYFGEILEWWGWALATWALPGLVFAIFTCANLIPRALSNHRWYREHFQDYPRERWAVIPGVL